MYFNHRPRSFSTPRMFYVCFVESILTLSFVAWYGSLNQKKKKKNTSIVTVCSKMIGVTLNDLSHMFKVRTKNLRLFWLILTTLCQRILSCFCLDADTVCMRNRLKNSFVPDVIGLLNNLLYF